MKKNSAYMAGVLIFLVILAIVAFIINLKISKTNESGTEENPVQSDSFMTVYGELNTEELLEQMKNSVVQIEIKVPDDSGAETTFVGSGVIIEITDTYVDIATARHMVEQTAKPLVYFFDGSLAYGSVLAYGKESDVAFVRVEATAIAGGIGDGISEAKAADNDFYASLQTDTKVYMIGSVSKVAGNLEEGILKEKEKYVELFQNDMLVCEASVIGGMSGGGTYYADGRLIGIIVGTNGNEGVSVAIPDVMAEYRSISQ